MNKRRMMIVAAAVLVAWPLAGPAMAVPVPFSDGSIFFESFDGAGGTFNPTGGTSHNAGAAVVVSPEREGDYFNYTLSATENGEYHAALDTPMEVDQAFVVEMTWTIDEGAWLFENAILMRTYDLSDDQEGLVHLEAIEAGEFGGPNFDIEVEVWTPQGGSNNGTPLGLLLTKGTQYTLAAHNLGDGNVVVYLDGQTAADDAWKFEALGGTVERIGNVGNVSVGLGLSSALLHDVSVGLPIGQQLTGDANLDGVVNDADLSLLLANWNQDATGDPDGGWGRGEFNATAPVDDADLSLLLSNWTGAGVVPEPATISILAAMAVGLLARRQRG